VIFSHATPVGSPHGSGILFALPCLENAPRRPRNHPQILPKTLNLDPTGQFLYSCNQRGDNIAVFRRDGKSGGLTFTGHYTPVGNPSIIVFLDLESAG